MNPRIRGRATRIGHRSSTATQLHDLLDQEQLLIIDARSAEEYSAGHIPGAINLPGIAWRTAATQNPATQGVGSLVFRTKEGKLDVARYETLLSRAGVTPKHEIVVYGNHAGKADGSVPAAILLKLGHHSVAFLDGVGVDAWQDAGYTVSRQTRTLPESRYKAVNAAPERLWSRSDVLKRLNDADVVIIDSRTPQEYAGDDLRGNKRGGHIPGAKLLDAAEFLDKSKTTISPEEAKKKIDAMGITKDKTAVIYCQSGTRCSHKELILKTSASTTSCYMTRVGRTGVIAMIRQSNTRRSHKNDYISRAANRRGWTSNQRDLRVAPCGPARAD